MKTAKAIFLDRDGTLIVDTHYLHDPAEVQLLPGVFEAIRLLREAGYLLFILTNQSGVGRGYFPLEDVHRCNARMFELLEIEASWFSATGIAPEAPDQPSRYRKPNPQFINECVDAFDLDREACWMIGDRSSDVLCGINAGIRSVFLGGCLPNDVPGDTAKFSTLLDFARAHCDGRA
ncbi:D-glycero-alpha-D-manno-heptose-1,7-bisphosphate 7-phosphatase [Actomonas aquatica]|uniref:D,D-heptose 1,7-bisphosphate phosphatase n=1 Tax=Actomonas aquatica TaxID=2866162 RepID=A0ABZ1CCA4_9BACT|nr:HAD family hydrolase [Opitutus sp. WL0086]WRQ89308.1 HAD family hydrolase [Opitutus sp. WL0086]